MVRNVLKNNTKINIPVLNGSQNKKCTEVYVLSDENWFNKFENTIKLLYKNEVNYTKIIEEIIFPWKMEILLKYPKVTISEFNISSIHHICKYLDISRNFYSSNGITERKKNEGLIDIIKYFNKTNYINAIGGKEIYTKENFNENGINLQFIKMGNSSFDSPYNSILDLIFRYPKTKIKEELKNYILI